MRVATDRWVLLLAIAVVALVSLPPLLVLGAEAVTGRPARTVTPQRLAELLGNTLVLTGLVVTASLVLGCTTAWLTHRTRLPARRLWSVLVTLPLVLPAYVLAVALSGMVGGAGFLTGLLAPLGVDRLPPARGLWAAATCLTMASVPIVHTLVSGALQRLDPALEESARLLGDPPHRVLARVVLPHLRGTVALAACVVALYVISDFGAVSMLRYETFTRAVYAQFQGRVDIGPAFTLCLVLVGVSAVFVVGQVRLRGREHRLPAVARPATLVPLSRRASLAASTFLGVVVLVSTVLPLATLTLWALRGLSSGNPPGSVVTETVHSLRFALVAAVVTVVLATPVALAARRRSPLARVVEGLPWVTHSLPHLAVGLAVLVLATAGPAQLYQSTVVLVLAYAAVFLPLAAGPIAGALRRLDPRLVEASSALGRSDRHTLTRVVAPLVRTPVLNGVVLVFFAVFHELPVTLLLRPTGTETLAVRMWGAMVEGQYTTASLAALVMAVVSLPLLAVHARATAQEGVRR